MAASIGEASSANKKAPDEVTVTLSCRCPCSIPNRRLVFTRAATTIQIGRSSEVTSKGFVPAHDNAWFDNPVMSRRHAKLFADFNTTPLTICITDVDSFHGTFVTTNHGWGKQQRLVNGEGFILSDGDVIRFGMDIFRYNKSYPPCSVEFRVVETPQIQWGLSRRVFTVPDDVDDEEDGDCQNEDDLIITSVRARSPLAALDPKDKTSVVNTSHVCINLTDDEMPSRMIPLSTVSTANGNRESIMVDLTSELPGHQDGSQPHTGHPDTPPLPGPSVVSPPLNTMFSWHTRPLHTPEISRLGFPPPNQTINGYGDAYQDGSSDEKTGDGDSQAWESGSDAFSLGLTEEISELADADGPSQGHDDMSEVFEYDYDEPACDDTEISEHTPPFCFSDSDRMSDSDGSSGEDKEDDEEDDEEDSEKEEDEEDSEEEDEDEDVEEDEAEDEETDEATAKDASDNGPHIKTRAPLLTLTDLSTASGTSIAPALPPSSVLNQWCGVMPRPFPTQPCSQARDPSPSDAALFKRRTPLNAPTGDSGTQQLQEKSPNFEFLTPREENSVAAQQCDDAQTLSAIKETLSDVPSSSSDDPAATTKDSESRSPSPCNSWDAPKAASVIKEPQDNLVRHDSEAPDWISIKLDGNDTNEYSVWTDSGDRFINNPPDDGYVSWHQAPHVDMDLTSAYVFHQSKLAAVARTDVKSRGLHIRDLVEQEPKLGSVVGQLEPKQPALSKSPTHCAPTPSKRSYEEAFNLTAGETTYNYPGQINPHHSPITGTSGHDQMAHEGIDDQAAQGHIKIPERLGAEEQGGHEQKPEVAFAQPEAYRPAKRMRIASVAVQVAACVALGGAATFSYLVNTAPVL
ncbi:hypothetical protein F4802DRAFT_602226 [Xylaria palmicola]|nr:hypothetical protein F4802DRAFT_602226 [Xylaria palmicola]